MEETTTPAEAEIERVAREGFEAWNADDPRAVWEAKRRDG